MTRLFVSLIVLVVAGVVAPSLASANVVLLPVSGVSVEPSELASVQEFARGHLESAGFRVQVGPGTNGPAEPSEAEALQAGRNVRAMIVVVVHLSRLGTTTHVKGSAYDVAGNRPPFRLGKSVKAVEGIDVALAEFVTELRNALNTQPALPGVGGPGGPGQQVPPDAAATTTVDTTTPVKKISSFSVGLRISGVFPTTRPESGDEPGIPGLGIYGLYDMRVFMAEIAFDFHAKSGEGDLSAGLGAYYPFSVKSFTPYIGGGMRYGYADYGDTGNEVGASVFAQGGVILGRVSTVQVRAQIDFFANLFRDGMVGDERRSTGIMIGFGIGYVRGGTTPQPQ